MGLFNFKNKFRQLLSPYLKIIKDEIDVILFDIDVLQQGGGGSSYFETIIWAEENGAISSNTDEWSYGNGSVGADIGIPSFWDCEAVGMVLNAETVGTSLGVWLRVNSANTLGIVATQRDNFVDFPTPVAISRGDRINFKTATEVGTWSDVRVGVVLRIQT